MIQYNQKLYNEILKLPIEKVDKAISFIRFLKQEQEQELILDSVEENELHEILESDEMIDSSQLFAKIKGMPND